MIRPLRRLSIACWSGERWEEVETDCEDGEVYLVEEEGCVGEWEEGEGVVSNSISFLLTRRISRNSGPRPRIKL